MYARAVDDTAARLRDLRHAEWEELGLGALALVLAVAATGLVPSLALPLFLGGLVLFARGMRSLWRRWALVDRLAGERDAYAIPEVLAYASRETTMDRRLTFAAMIRGRMREPKTMRVAAAEGELEALAAELEDELLSLEPACAVACMRLVSDVDRSPLLNAAVTPEELRSRIRQIRSGFTARRLAA